MTQSSHLNGRADAGEVYEQNTTGKQIMRKALHYLGVILIVMGALMCINDVPPGLENTISWSDIFRNTLLGVLTCLAGLAMVYIAKNGFTITITWKD